MSKFKNKTQGTLEYLKTIIREYEQNKLDDKDFVKTIKTIYITFESNLEIEITNKEKENE